MKAPRTLIIIAGFALALLGGVTWAEWRDATRAPALADQVTHTRDVQTNLNELLSRVQDIEAGAHGFVLTGEPAFLETFLASLNTADSQFRVVRTLTSNNPNQQARCDILERLIAQVVAVAQATVDLRRGSGFEAARQMVASGQGKAVMGQIRAEIALMYAEEQTLLGRRRAANRDQRRRARALAATGSGLSFLLLGAAFASVWRENRLRHQAEQRLHEFNDQLEQRVREQTAELEQASRTSREVEERFRIMVEGITDYAILMLDPSGHVLSWNPGAARLKGYRDEEIVGQHFSRLYLEEDVARGKPAMDLEQAVVGGRIEDEGWRVRKDGTRFWANVIITTLRDEEGRVRGFVQVTRDMTERRQVEDALRKSEQFLAQSQQLAHFGNWMVDLETGALTWSEELYRIYGVSPDRFVPTGDAFVALIHPDDQLAMRSWMSAVLSDKPGQLEFRVIRPDGTIRVIEGDGKVQVNADNKPILLVGTAHDITGRKRAEDELRRSIELLDQTGQMAKIGGWELELDTQTLHWAKETCRIHEIDPSIQPSVAEAIQFYAPEARPVIAAAVQAAIDAGTPFDLELPLVTARGRRIWVRAQGTAERRDGKTIRVFGAFQDLTERKLIEDALRESEERLRISQEAARWGVFEYKYQSGNNYWSPELEALWGYSKGEFGGTADAWLQRIHPEDRAEVKRQEERALETGEYLGEYRIVWPDGSVRWMYSRGRLSYDERGQPSRLLGINLDITDRKQLEAQLRQAQKMESVGQLASGIAHDFNNLLTVINGTSELVLAQVREDDPMHADVEDIHAAGERAAVLTRQLLAFSRQQILEPRVMNFNTVVRGLESLLRRLLGDDIGLAVVPAPDLGNVKADTGQIEQVITNLAVNARDAMPQGGKLTIETQNVELDEYYDRQDSAAAVPPGPYVQLIVSDSGVGMDEATRTRIFEPFFTTKGPGKGTGLGLSTVFGIVKQSQGFIWVYSEVGHGTTFKICLPQVTEAVGSDRTEAAPSVVSSVGTETILLVEDNAGLRKLATRVLEPAGYTVLGAADGGEALRLVERHEEPIDLLLSDLVMPGMSGRDLAERLAQTRPGTKVLYMSGYTGDNIVRRGVLDARMPFLNKPFTAAALLQKVRAVLDTKLE